MFLSRRAGQIKELWVVQLPICPMMSPASELFSKSAECRLSDEMVDCITAPPLIQLMDCQSRDEIWEFIKEQEDSRRSKGKSDVLCEECVQGLKPNFADIMTTTCECNSFFDNRILDGTFFGEVLRLLRESPPAAQWRLRADMGDERVI